MVCPRLLCGGGPDVYQPRRIRKGQRAEQDAVDDAEDRRVGADPERQGEPGDQCKAGILEERSEGVSEIEKEISHCGL